jgi:hypothetical protein
MQYNDVREVEVITDVVTEPVTIDEVKRQLNLLFSSDGSFQFDDDDNYLNELIPRCREILEQYTGLSFATKTLRAIIRNECGGTEIPGGPITGTPTIKDQDGSSLTSIVLSGNQFKVIDTKACYLDIEYTAGYEAGKLPKGLVKALVELIAWAYNHRGEEINVAYCQQAMESAAPFKRTSWIA